MNRSLGRQKIFLLTIIVLYSCLLATRAGSQTEPSLTINNSGLPLPRFVSLRTDPINMRVGPGIRYPVDWVYLRRNLPMEIILEFDNWRRVRDPEGVEGWVHQNMLSGRRTGYVIGTHRRLMRAGFDTSKIVATLEHGVIVEVKRCPPRSSYCRVATNGLDGWIQRDHFWGTYKGEMIE